VMKSLAGSMASRFCANAAKMASSVSRRANNFMSGTYYDDDGLHEGDRYVGPSKYDSEWKDCKRCYQRVYMSTDHGICDACANAMERGGEY
jgi:hypothetical protein